MFVFRNDKFNYKSFFKSKKGSRSANILSKPFSNMLTEKESCLGCAKDNLHNLLFRK